MKRSKKNFIVGIGISALGTSAVTTYALGRKIYKESLDCKVPLKNKNMEEYYRKNHKEVMEKLDQYNYEKFPLYCENNNYVIEVINIKCSKLTDNTVIIVHGLRSNYYNNLEVAFEYLSRGYNVILYNQRHTGKTGGKQFTFGYWEKYDLNEVVKYAKLEYPKGNLGIHGFSMGAATAALHCEVNEQYKNVDFYILDAPYDTMKSAVKLGLKSRHIKLTPYALWAGNLYVRAKEKFSYKDVQPSKAIKKTTVPVMIIHGTSDNVTDYNGSRNMYNSISGSKKELWLIENIGHCKAFNKIREEYCKRVFNFLRQHSMI